MKLNRVTIGVIVGVVLASMLNADEVTITTFYPSPNAVYKEFQAKNSTALATDGESFVGIGTDSPVSELDIRHANASEPSALMISGTDRQQVAINLFTKGAPPTKSLSGQTDIKAWQIVAKGDDRQTQNQSPNDERNHLKFSFYDGDDQQFHETLSLGSGKVGIRRIQPEYELDVNGTLGIGDSAVDFGTAEIAAETPASGYASQTTFRAGSAPVSGEVRHAFYFKTRDEGDASTTKRTVADVAVDGKVIAGEDVVLTSTGHNMSQTGFVTGSYVGDGTANRSISLGFQPRFVKIWSQALGSGFVNASVFEKTAEMPGGFAVYSFSTEQHQSVPGGSPTRNEDTLGFTYTYYMDAGFQVISNGFQVSGTDNSVSFSGYFETNGLAADNSGLQYFYIAYR